MKKLIKRLQFLDKLGAKIDTWQIEKMEDAVETIIQLELDKDKFPKTKAHHVGIEIEFHSTSDFQVMAQDFFKAKLFNKISLGEDGSLNGDNGRELRVLDTEKNIFKTLQAVCKILKKHKAKVESDCGLHVHLDMRNRNYKAIGKKFLKIQPLMHGLVKKNRIDNTYCPPVIGSIPKNKYYAFHYAEHLKTIEVRLHHGSVDFLEISNWLKFLFKVVNSSISKDVSKPADIRWRGPIKNYINSKFNSDNVKLFTMVLNDGALYDDHY